jgi:tripartite-type tricarboxylate transporter receptor subunit TctC
MRRIGRVFGFLLAVFATTGGALAQSKYPERPVRIVVPFGAGGVADITVRVVAEKLGEKLGQRFVIENTPGAGGISAARSVLSAPADGYTLAMLTNGTAISVPLFKSLPFDPLKDFVPISSLGFFDFVFATNTLVPFDTITGFMRIAVERPGLLNVGTINVGSSQNLSAELFKATTGMDFAIIPYRTTPELLIGLLRNDVQMVIDTLAAVKPNLSDGKLRVLASSGPVRAESTPDLQTAQEAGVRGFDVTSWNALFAPAGTPAEIVEVLNAALRETLDRSDVKQRLLELGIQAKATAPDELRERLRADIAKWTAVIERAGIQRQ